MVMEEGYFTSMRSTSKQLYNAIFWSCLARPNKLFGNECNFSSGSDALVRGIQRSGHIEAFLGGEGEHIESWGGTMNLGYL